MTRRTTITALLGTFGAALSGCAAGQAPAASTSGGVPSGTTAGTTASTAATASSTPEPTPSGPTIPVVADPLPAGMVNALIVGTDSNFDNTNTDVLLVAQLSADRSRVTLCSIPRDCYVSVAGGGKAKINSVLSNRGVDALKQTVSNLFGGLPLHYVAITNFNDFVKMVTLFDGFSVYNKIDASFPHQDGTKTHFPAGVLTQHRDGWLFYVRQRKQLPNGDLDRTERHRAVVKGMITYAQELLTNPVRFVAVATGVFSCVRVTGPRTASTVLGLVPALRTIMAGKILSTRVPISGYGSNGTDVVDTAKLAVLAAALRAGDVSAYVAANGND